MGSTIPPMAVAGQDYLRKKKKPTGYGGILATNPFTAPAVKAAEEIRSVPPAERKRIGVLGTTARGALAAGSEVGRQAGEVAANVGEAAKATGEYLWGTGVAAPTGAAKQATGAAEHAAAATAARTASPEAQPDPTPVTEPTSTGAGPRLNAGDRVVSLPGEQGYAIVHARGADPATQPGGFAYSGGRPAPAAAPGPDVPSFAAGVPAERLAGGATMRRGPVSPTGGHSWTLRTPGAQESAYDTARYRRQVQARQAGEDEAIQGAEARAARSAALTEQPFAPEMAAVAGKVGAERARQAPQMRSTSLAMEAFMRYQQRAAEIDAQPDLSDEEKRAAKMDAEREAWMSIIAVQPRARKPEENLLGGFGATPSVEEPT